MLDIVRFCTYGLLITKVLFSISSITSATQSIENINSTGKFSRIHRVIYSNLTEFDANNTSDFPKHPKNLKIEYIGKNKVKLQWKMEKGSLKFLKGFCLQLIRNYGIRKMTEPENITFVPINDSLKDFDMILDLSHGSSDIILHCLPRKSDCVSTVRRTVVMVLNEGRAVSPKWKFPIIIFNQQKDKLEVDFKKPSTKISKFEMCLQDRNNTPQCSTFEKPPVIFDKITGGKYIVKLTPCDLSLDNKNCTQTDKNNCTNCETTETSYITYKVTCENRKLKEYLYPLFGGLCIGILALLILFTAVKINGLRHHNLEKKSILLLNTSDNVIHEKAVENFIASLENLNIIVHRPTLPFSEEKLQWLLNMVDNVVLLDSLALGRRQEAWAMGKDYGEFLLEANSKELTKYLFTTINMFHNPKKENHFLRCKWSFVPEESEFKNYPTDSPAFIIPDDLQIFAEMIHRSAVDLRECKFSKSMLKQNILEEIKFITQNPNWFKEKYGTPIITETEVEIVEVPQYQHMVSNKSDMISHVSSYLHKMNQETDKELGINMVNLNNVEVMSV